MSPINRSYRSRMISAAVSGLLLALATPPIPLGFIAWFALFPLFMAIEGAQNNKESYLIGFISGLVFYLGTVYWIAMNTGTNILVRLSSGTGSILLLASTFGLVTLVLYRVYKIFGRGGFFLAPILFVFNETLWHFSELAFPWALFALTQGEYLSVLQMASVGGTAVISAWVVAINTLIFVGRERRITGITVIVLISLPFLLGTLREKSVYERVMPHSLGKIALVQGNIDAAKKWELGAQYSLDIYEPLTQGLRNEQPDLVVWPETAAPVYVQQNRRWRNHFQAFADSLGFSLITGGRYVEFVDDKRIPFNAAFMIKPRGRKQFERYEKVHLVPFGERVPFQKFFPILAKLNFGQAEFKPGEGIAKWTVAGRQDTFTVAPMICYESIFPYLGMEVVRHKTDVILNLTNDGWFDGTSEQRQHLLLSVIRSIETGRSLVRATNTGISAIATPSGRILQSLPTNVRGVLATNIPIPVDTPFNRGGWITPYIFFFVGLLIILFVLGHGIYYRKRTIK